MASRITNKAVSFMITLASSWMMESEEDMMGMFRNYLMERIVIYSPEQLAFQIQNDLDLRSRASPGHQEPCPQPRPEQDGAGGLRQVLCARDHGAALEVAPAALGASREGRAGEEGAAEVHGGRRAGHVLEACCPGLDDPELA